jgi:hypothetical protein
MTDRELRLAVDPGTEAQADRLSEALVTMAFKCWMARQRDAVAPTVPPPGDSPNAGAAIRVHGARDIRASSASLNADPEPFLA